MSDNPQQYDGNGGWREWSRYVRLGITELKDSNAKLSDEIGKLKLELATLKVKMSMWGGVGATIATAAIQLVMWLLKTKGGG